MLEREALEEHAEIERRFATRAGPRHESEPG
jgi:hypothetical protein